VFVLVEGLIVLIVVRDRRRGGETGEPRQVHGHTRLEIIWTVVPLLLVILLFGLTIGVMKAVAAPPAREGDVHVRVVGHRWWWQFDYPDYGITTANELHIPVDGAAHLTLESADVIHSFWVPQLAGKTDVIPGEVNSMWLSADAPGTYDGQCSEFCGIQHAGMRIHVIVESREDFDAWVKGQQAPPVRPATALAQQGEDMVLTGVCSSCHSVRGTSAQGTIGPDLTHLMSRTTMAGGMYPLNGAYLRRWLANTQEMKPGNLMVVQLPSDDMAAVLAYLTQLK
jgi:cytochrome c oxidase subunit 2